MNGAFAFVQERRAERAAERLRDMLPRRVIVLRDGRLVSLDARDVVPGDVVVLSAGTASRPTPVGRRRRLLVDESLLTGESVPSLRRRGIGMWAGFVVDGEGRAAVRATGADTRLAGIAASPRPCPAAQAAQASSSTGSCTVAVIAVGVGVGILRLSLLVGTPARDGFLFAIGVTVALVPEGSPRR